MKPIALAIAVIMIALQVPSAWRASQTAQTNMGTINKFLTENTTTNDVVVFAAWPGPRQVDYYCPNFPAPVVTIPPGVTNNIVTRFDLVDRYIEEHPEPDIRDLVPPIMAALARHGKVVCVTGINWTQQHQWPPSFPQLKAACPNMQLHFYYSYILAEEFACFIGSLPSKGYQLTQYEVPTQNISTYERSTLLIVQ